MKAFVTGATGFVGSHVAHVLAEQGAALGGERGAVADRGEDIEQFTIVFLRIAHTIRGHNRQIQR